MTTVHNSPNSGTNRNYVFRTMKCKTIKFQVKTNANVNICLSPAPSETPYQQYEIFLGGWGGGESAIRRNKKDDVTKVKTPEILNKNQFRGFWIISGPHVIKVGKEGHPTPFLIHKDTAVRMDFSYYGYCTSYGSTGQWTFSDDDYGQGIDMGAIGAVVDEIFYPPAGLFPPGTPAPPPPYYPPVQPPAVTGGLRWVPCKSVHMCPAPVQAGPGAASPYVATAHHNGGLIIGCVTPTNMSVCHIPWGGQAHAKLDFFLLSNPGNAELVWQVASGGNVPVGALQGGYSEQGEPLYVGRFRIGGRYISGKVHPSHRVCYVAFQGRETGNASYEVLCLKTVPLSILGM